MKDPSERNVGEPGERIDRELARLLSSSIGLEKAQESVTEAIRALGLQASALTPADAFAVLEKIALQPGIVGITARFAKSRVHLKWSEGSEG